MTMSSTDDTPPHGRLEAAALLHSDVFAFDSAWPAPVTEQTYRLDLASIPPAAGLGVRLVLVLGVRPGIDAMVRDGGREPIYSHGQRVTDGAAMEAAMQAAGAARMEVEARLSKVASCPCRHPSLRLSLPHHLLRVVYRCASGLTCSSFVASAAE